MRNTRWILLLLMLAGCASAPTGNSSSQPLPVAVKANLPASTPGTLTESLQRGLDESLDDLAAVLGRLRKSQPLSDPAKPGL